MRGFALFLTAGLATAAAGPPELTLDRTSLTFAAPTGGPNPAPQAVRITNTGDIELEWEADENESWLSVSPNNGKLKKNRSHDMSVSVNVGGLLPGTYTGSILVQGQTGTTASPQTITVTFTVSTLPRIGADPASLAFDGPVGGPKPASRTLTVSNTGGGVLNWSASASAAWLGLSPASGTLTAGASRAVTVQADGAGLAQGTHAATIAITAAGAANTPRQVDVTFTLNAVPTIGLSTASLTFDAPQGGSNPPAQSMSVSNSGSGTLAWTATDDAAWLSLSPLSGSQSPGLSETVTVLVNTAGLLDGSYLGTITFTAPGASNTPRSVAVRLDVSALPKIAINPADLTFTIPSSGADPAAQAMSVTNVGAGTLQWSLQDDATWLSASPPSGSLTGVQSEPVTLSVHGGGLAPGTHTALIQVTDPASANTAQSAFVTLNIAEPPPPNHQAAGSCGLLGLEFLALLPGIALLRRKDRA